MAGVQGAHSRFSVSIELHRKVAPLEHTKEKHDHIRKGIVMPLAIKKPFTHETQTLRDAIDLSDKQTEEIPCTRCDAAYVLVYTESSSVEQKLFYRELVEDSMGNCAHHPSSIVIIHEP